jgi:hypothetical protein
VSDDPRVNIVEDALDAYLVDHPRWCDQPCCEFTDEREASYAALVREAAAIAVEALDAYDGPKFSSVVHECCERPIEADLRERIAQEIEAHYSAPDDKGSTDYDEGLRTAARIARGQA